MKVYVCQVVPLVILHVHENLIEAYNENLLKWCDSNGITVIKSPPHFRLCTGEVDDKHFKGEDITRSGLKRLGDVRLLGVVKKE